MGGKQAKYSYFTGPEVEGETRCLRSAQLPEGAPLVDNYRGMTTIKEIFL